jgi:anti-sigma factor RsiW
MSDEEFPQLKTEHFLELSCYLDQALSEEERVAVEHKLATDSSYQDLQKAVSTVREAIHQSVHSVELKTANLNLWSAIQQELTSTVSTAAEQEPPSSEENRFWLAECCSVYMDGELTPEEKRFEQALFRNEPANLILQDFLAVSAGLKQWYARTEDQCLLDCSSSVMALFQEEQFQEEQLADSATENLPGDETLFLLSSHIDQALTPRETIALNRLIESEASAKLQLTQLATTSDCVQTFFQTMTQLCSLKEGVLWDGIEQQLETEQVAAKKQARSKAGQKGLILVFRKVSNSFARLSPASVVATAATLLLALFISKSPLINGEVASVSPQHDLNLRNQQMTIASALPGNFPSSHFQPEKPSIFPKAAMTVPKAAKAPPVDKTPTSEEYLFSSLEAKDSKNNLTVILGI